LELAHNFIFKVPPLHEDKHGTSGGADTKNTKLRLKDYDSGHTAGLDKNAGQALFSKLDQDLGEIQELLYAAGQHSLLIVLQGMDTSGKDGTVSHVMSSVNPQGCRVLSFKAPTPEEQAHDFLWRVHKVVPAKGILGIFNRSHYEDVLVTRVHELVPEAIWKKRYTQINAFEELLVENGTLIFKFFLHISKEEQAKRLQAREDDKDKRWKLSLADFAERAYWDAYVEAYEEALAKCSTKLAPWYVVPADHKWFRNLAIAQTLVDNLKPYKERWRTELEARGEKVYQELQKSQATEVKKSEKGESS
jgi:PPK2 family polyphosphate:nucleotide phosphotransferase